MEVGYNKGIVVSDGKKKVILDPETPKTPIGIPTVISHAHSDHTSGLKGLSPSFCTSATKNLYEATTNREAKNTEIVEFFEPFEVGELEIELIPAGHLLGAAQTIVRHGDETLLYTGDFCPEPLLSVPGAHVPSEPIDVCIIETTYGDRSLHFADRAQSRMNILNYCFQQLSLEHYPVLNVTQLGGAQELISLFESFSNGLPIVVDEKIMPPSLVYDLNLKNSSLVLLEEFTFDSMALVLLSRSTKELPKPLVDLPVSRGMISGQTARFQFSRFDFTVPLSTHASYEELLQVVKRTSPAKIFTRYNYASSFAEHLRTEFSVHAEPMDALKEKTVRAVDEGNIRKKKGVQLTLNDFF